MATDLFTLDFTLEDLAQLSEDQAVRIRFDRHNLRWMQRGFAGVVVAALFEIVASVGSVGSQRAVDFSVSGLTLALGVVFYLATRRVSKGKEAGQGWTRLLHPLRAWLQAHLRAAVVGSLIFGYFLLFGFNLGEEGAVSWAMSFPWIVLFFRLAVSEHFLIHGTLYGTAVVYALVEHRGDQDSATFLALLIAGGVTNAICLGVGLFVARRKRRTFLADWRVARERSRDQLRIRQELDYAREIQLSMLPQEGPRLPWLEMASLSLPATEVGGDYYDYFAAGDDRLAVVAGDVAGHGFAAGLLLSGVRSCLTLLVDEIDRPLEVMSKLNYMIRRTTRRRMLVTLAILTLDRARALATVTSAGHPPVLLRRDGSSEVEELMTSSLPLGSRLAEDFACREVPFGPGDTFLLYTDGLYELTDGTGESYGLERLSQSLESTPPGASAAEIKDALLGDLWTFKGSEHQDDDITFVVVKVRPPA